MLQIPMPAAALLVLTTALAGEAAPRAGIAGSQTLTPTGSYEAVLLRCTSAGKGGAVSWWISGGLRDGRMAVGDGVGLREPGGTIERTGASLKGSFRTVNLGYAKAPRPGGDAVLDATIAPDGSVAGTVTVTGYADGKVTGHVLSEAVLAVVSRQVV